MISRAASSLLAKTSLKRVSVCELGPRRIQIGTIVPEIRTSTRRPRRKHRDLRPLWENGAAGLEVNCRSGYNSLLISGLSYKTAFSNELLTSIFPL